MRRKASPPTSRSGWRSSRAGEDRPVDRQRVAGGGAPVLPPPPPPPGGARRDRPGRGGGGGRGLADGLEQRSQEVAAVETKNNGKPLVESKIDVAMAIETLRYYAGWADKVTGDTLPVSGNFFTYTLREPVGVVGAIVPWNFPLNLASWKVAPALAAGCTVVLKPAHETPLTALLLGEIAVAAGLPPGALNVVPGAGAVAGAALVRHRLVDKIAFTGSTEVGQWIMREAAATVKRVTLELGGKSPNIIFADADLPAAVRGAQNGIFYGKGEVCAAGSRLLVEQTVHDQVLEQLAERAKKLKIGRAHV